LKEFDYISALENSLYSGADSSEIYHSNEKIQLLMMKDNRIVTFNYKDVDYFGLRIIKDKCAGFASTTCSDNIGLFFDKAIESSLYSSKINWQLPTEKNAFSDSHIFDENLVNTCRHDMMNLGESICSKLQKYCPEVNWDVNIENRVIRKRIINSHGVDADYLRTFFAVIIGGTLVGTDQIISVFDYTSSSNFETIDFPEIIHGLSERIEFSKGKYKFTGKEKNILFTPNGFTSLIKALEHLIKPYLLKEKDSPLYNKQGMMIADSDITIYDDGLLEWGAMTSPVDDEGVPVRVTPIIESGIFKGGIGSTSEPDPVTGISTGNCFRNSDCRTQVKASTLVMNEGDLSFTKMVESMDSGIIIDSLVGGFPRCDGEFSFTVQTGFGVKKGVIGGRIKDISISGNIFNVLQNIYSRGRGTKLCFDRYLMPSVIVADCIRINR
jgi:predicted Zn-dependent protease